MKDGHGIFNIIFGTLMIRVGLRWLVVGWMMAQVAWCVPVPCRQAVQDALQVNPDLQQARLSTDYTARDVKLALSFLLPNVALEAAWTRQNVQTVGDSLSQTLNNKPITYAANVQQPLVNVPSLMALHAAGYYRDGAVFTLIATVQSLMASVTQAYVNVLIAEDTYQTLQEQQQALQRQWHDAEQRQQSGVVSVADVSQAFSAYQSAQSGVIAARYAIKNAYEALKTLTGKHYTMLDHRLPKPLPLSPVLAEQALIIAKHYSGTLHAVEAQAQGARCGWMIKRLMQLPTVNGIWQWRDTSNLGVPTMGTFNQTNRTIGVSVQWLIPGGSQHVAAQQAHDQYEIAQQAIVKTAMWLDQTVITLKNQLYAGYEQYCADQTAVIAAKKALNDAHSGYDAQTVTLLDVLNAQTLYTQARVQLAKDRYQYYATWIAFKQALGVLNLQDL
jgi:outer membrane protein